jgi:hypothetical protein
MRRRLSFAARAYIIAISLAAALGAIALSRSPQASSGVAAFLMITALGAFAHAYPIQGFRHQAYQVTLPFIVLAAALFSGYELLAFIVLIHVAEQIRLRRPLHIQWFNAGNYFLSAALAAIIYQRADAMLQAGALGHLTAALAAASSFILVNRLLLGGILWLARGLSLLASGLFEPELLAADLVIAWVAGPMLVVAVEAGSWTVLVTAGPLLLARPALSALLRRHTRPSAATRAEAPAA